MREGELLTNLEPRSSYSIEQYFTGTNVFITGTTGFLGSMLLEKLLRSCLHLKRVYIIIRPKKEKGKEQRYEEFLNYELLKRLKVENPKFSEKITVMAGDCALPNLGLSDEDQRILIEEVNCVFHCAATVRFDEKIRTATYTNVRATSDILGLSRKMKNLTSFVYVSTAYSNCARHEIKEEFYDVPITGKQLMTLVKLLDDDMLEKITPILIGKWPNTYVFTKAIAENVVKCEGKGLPVAVVRPSIVTGAVKEPLPGWIDNVYGTTGILVGGCLGLIRILHCNSRLLAEMVPADFVTNCIIAAGWNIGVKKRVHHDTMVLYEENNNIYNSKVVTDIPIYNYVSTVQKPLTWAELYDLVDAHAGHIPSPFMIWYPFVLLCSNYYIYKVSAFFLHLVPAYIADFVAKCIGKQPKLVKGYSKIDKFTKVLTYFTTKQWQFCNNNTQELWKTLKNKDRQKFEFNMENLDWDAYFSTYIKGGRVYLLKDTLDTVAKGKVKFMRLKIAHYVLVGVLLLGLVRFVILLWNIF